MPIAGEWRSGRPPNDHRVVLGGILWVARTGSSWREMPEEYSKWETAYKRHELWVRLWNTVEKESKIHSNVLYENRPEALVFGQWAKGDRPKPYHVHLESTAPRRRST